MNIYEKAKSNAIKCNGKEYLFIHIPKTAGTAISRIFFNGRQITHRKLIEYPRKFWTKSVAVVRNPYERLISVYNYCKMKKSYWHSDDGSTLYSLHPLYEYCNTHTFKEFLNAVCNDQLDDELLEEQSSFIITPGNRILTEIIRFESLEEGFSKLFDCDIRFPVVNESSKELHGFDDEMISLVNKKYARDFFHFGPFKTPPQYHAMRSALLWVLLYIVLIVFFNAMNQSPEDVINDEIVYDVGRVSHPHPNITIYDDVFSHDDQRKMFVCCIQAEYDMSDNYMEKGQRCDYEITSQMWENPGASMFFNLLSSSAPYYDFKGRALHRSIVDFGTGDRYGCYIHKNHDIVLYYANVKWDDEWGGETLFYDKENNLICVIPYTPNRMVVFDGDIVYRFNGLSRTAPKYNINVSTFFWKENFYAMKVLKEGRDFHRMKIGDY